jgi:hypothetical protein
MEKVDPGVAVAGPGCLPEKCHPFLQLHGRHARAQGLHPRALGLGAAAVGGAGELGQRVGRGSAERRRLVDLVGGARGGRCG